MMGSTTFERYRENNETQHRVQINDFSIGAHEVTVGDFREFVNSANYKTNAEKNGRSIVINELFRRMEEKTGLNWNKATFTSEESQPVVHISWYDAIEYCNWRSREEGLTPVYTISGKTTRLNPDANGYRLPTEAEWEYACRAGTSTAYHTGNSITPGMANYDESDIHKTVAVAKYPPNKWGLYGMHGNVFEWCGDSYEKGSNKVIRSGSWISKQSELRSAFRGAFPPDKSFELGGFRIARNAQ
jgi:formylglycine-generating enzyme required for sulfatase activity